MLIRWSDDDGVYIVDLPEFPNCRTHGSTYVEAARQGQQVLTLLIQSAEEEGETLPRPRVFEAGELAKLSLSHAGSKS
jgi:antitoxin HicB